MPSLLEALEHKYGDPTVSLEDTEDGGISVAIFVPVRSARSIVPALLVLNDCDISTAGDKEALEGKLPLVEELDLAKNKLSDWSEVFTILELIPRLKFVNLSFNELSSDLRDIKLDKGLTWTNMTSLVLNSTHIKWESVREMLDHVPNLEELHLSLNDYECVSLCQDDQDQACSKSSDSVTKDDSKRYLHPTVRKLHFTGNPITHWNEVCKLGDAFPNLQSLVLAECPIRSLDLAIEEGTASGTLPGSSQKLPHDSFQHLKFLNLNSTQISAWIDIERLSKFPSLCCVRIQGCPLWDHNEYTEHERRQFFIARLPNVHTLNGGGMIGSDEREASERAFIRYYMDKPEDQRPARYDELTQVYGKLEPLVHVKLRPDKRAKVTFTCGSISEIKSVDIYRTVNDLKIRLENFTGFSASKMKLFYVDQDLRKFQEPEEMRHPHKQLFSYNICSGDEIIIDIEK